MNNKIIEFDNVYKEFSLGSTKVHALNGISFSVKAGEFTAIVGPSGSGKSTILNLIGCIDLPTGGSVTVKGIDSKSMKDSYASVFRNSTIGFIFQSFNLIPVLNVYENIEFPLIIANGTSRKNGQKDKIMQLIEDVGLKEFVKQKPDKLSGGQRQRVAIARALVTSPELVIADEPTANLDQKTGESILDIMKKMNTSYHITFLFSTHSRLIMNHVGRIIEISDGKILDDSFNQKN